MKDKNLDEIVKETPVLNGEKELLRKAKRPLYALAAGIIVVYASLAGYAIAYSDKIQELQEKAQNQNYIEPLIGLGLVLAAIGGEFYRNKKNPNRQKTIEDDPVGKIYENKIRPYFKKKIK